MTVKKEMNRSWRLSSGFVSSLIYQKWQSTYSSKLPQLWLIWFVVQNTQGFRLGSTSKRSLRGKLNVLSGYTTKLTQSIESKCYLCYKSSFSALFVYFPFKSVLPKEVQTMQGNSRHLPLMLKVLRQVKMVKFCSIQRAQLPCFTSTTLPGAPHSLGKCCFWKRSWTHVLHYVGDVSQGFLLGGRVSLFTQFS